MIRTLSLASLALAIALFPTRSAAQDDPDDAEVRTRLARRVSVDATDMLFEDVVQLISETAKVGIVIDPASKLRGKTVTFRTGEVTADEALGRLLEDRGAVRAVRDGLVLLTTAARLAAYPPPLREPPEGGDPERNDVLERIAAKRMTLDFTDTPLDDVLQFVMNVTQVNIVPDPVSLATLEGDGTVSLNVKDVRLSHALNVLAFLTVVRPPGQAPQPLRWGARHGVLVLASARRLEEFPALPPAPPDEGGDPAEAAAYQAMQRKLTLDFSGTPLKDVVQFLRESTRQDIVLDAPLADDEPKVGLKLDQASALVSLNIIGYLCDLQLRRAGGAWHLGPRPRCAECHRVKPSADAKCQACDK